MVGLATQGKIDQPTGDLVSFERDAVSEIMLAVADPALFTRARFDVAGPFNHHLPLLFWLTNAIRPYRVVCLGVQDGIAQFGACQAIDRLGVGEVHGFGDWVDGLPPKHLQAYQARHYAEFSTLSAMGSAKAVMPFADGSVDMLIVDAPQASLERLAAAGWSDKLSARGVVLVHGTGTNPEGVDGINLFARDRPVIVFPNGSGMTLIGPEGGAATRLTSVFRSAGDPVAMSSLNQVLRRLGQAQVFEIDIQKVDGIKKELEESRRAVAQLSTRLDEETASLVNQRDAIAQAEIRLAGQTEDLAVFAKELARAQDAIENMKTERRARSGVVETLTAELDGCRSENAALSRDLEEARTLCDAYAASTSWRLTGPLRFVVNRLRR